MAQIKTFEKNKAIKLFGDHIPQNKIAKKLNVRTATVSKWFKEWSLKDKEKQKTISNFKSRLLELSENPNTPTEDIKNLALAIEKTQNSN